MRSAPDTLSKAANVIEIGMDRGLHHGAQLYVSLRGKTVADVAFGLADVDANSPMTTDHLMLWLSACKPFGAVAIAQLWEQGKLDLDAPISDTIAEFGLRGKDDISMRNILMHTSGFRKVSIDFVEPDWDSAVLKVCAVPLEEGWLIGQTAGYDPRGAWYILGEMVRRIDGRPYDQYIREEIFEPLGMHHSSLGMTPEAHREYGDRIAPTYTLTGDGLIKSEMHLEAQCVPCFPAGNGRGPVRELGRFYEMLLDGGSTGTSSIVKSATVEEFTWRHRVGTFDKTFGHKMDWGLGFMVDSNKYGELTVPYSFGSHCSTHAFGHGGRECVAAFADPEHGLVVALAFNGMPGEPKHNKRNRDFATAIYEDLGLVR